MDPAVSGADGGGGAAAASSSTPGESSARGKGAARKPAAVKRKSATPTGGAKPKTRKKKKASQPAGSRLGYTVQQGEDMLLVISNTSQYENLTWRPKKKKRKKGAATKKTNTTKKKTRTTSTKRTVNKTTRQKNEKAATKGSVVEAPPPTLQGHLNNTAGAENSGRRRIEPDHRWGQSLPEEVLVSIFQMLVVQDGAVPILCRVARVCRLWNAAASSPSLWRRVSVGFCWAEPGKSQTARMEQSVKETLRWLAEDRLSQLRAFTLNHWKKNVDYAIEVVSRSCPQLSSLTLSYCTGVTEMAFQSLAAHSHSLDSVNMQHSEYQVDGLANLLETNGSTIRQILFSHGPKNDRLLAVLSRGCCPDLELLEINRKLDSGFCQLPIAIQALQQGCPRLKTFRMLNVIPLPKAVRRAPGPGVGPDAVAQGFPLLEELCMATASVSFMSNRDLWAVLLGSPRLRVLDLRGCFQLTPQGLEVLPCAELECLFWGHYSTKGQVALPSARRGLHKLAEKWGGSLRELDIANQLFAEEDLEETMGHLAGAPGAEGLRSLNLMGTRITPAALRLIIGHSTALRYLNLSSCRNLPRGLKRVYRGQEDIRQLLDTLE